MRVICNNKVVLDVSTLTYANLKLTILPILNDFNLMVIVITLLQIPLLFIHEEIRNIIFWFNAAVNEAVFGHFSNPACNNLI